MCIAILSFSSELLQGWFQSIILGWLFGIQTGWDGARHALIFGVKGAALKADFMT